MKVPARSVGESILLQVLLRRVGLVFPPAAVVEFHPVIFSILDFACVFKGLGQEVSEVVVVRGIFEAEVADISEVFRKFLYA